MSQTQHKPDVVENSEGRQRDEQDESKSIHTVSRIHEGSNIEHAQTQMSQSHDPVQPYSSYIEVPDEVYDRLSPSRKLVIVGLLSFCGFLAPISSTAVLAAIPEVASTYNSTGTIINLSNALYMLFMGISPCFWGPLSQVYGRRIVGALSLLR